MSRRRPGTAGSVRSTSAINPLRVRPGSRPGSAREWFEAYNQRRNEEAWRLEEWKNTVNSLKKKEWQAQYYTAIAQPKHKSVDEEELRKKEEKERKLADRRARLTRLFQEDERRYQDEREQKYRESRHRTVHHHIVYPEVEMLKCRLDDLKKKNLEERQKMTESLSYEIWRRNSPQVRQVSDVDICMAGYRITVNKRKNISFFLEREKRDEFLRQEEVTLEREKLRLHEITQRRLRLKDLRQRKELELFWARQYQLKLKKKAADIQQELLEDENIIEDILRGLPEDEDEQMKHRRSEAEWMKTVLGEQRKLESMREKEYELLFSEEAESMWKKRQAEWEREQRARDRLMGEVLHGLQQQVQDQQSRNVRERETLDSEKAQIQRSIIDIRDQMQDLEREEKERREKHHTVQVQPSQRMMQEAATLRRDREDEERKLQEHRREISRLEQQLQQLWGPQYAPPKYGRKRFVW
ncbi:trichoplein keratin filament-binding protein-like [Penaeus indicus]|uniref:trichoplein keratin filament-binding protein-like n=1 Tax=Penaeus indicus TaxID=29960 RepID=UPI00300D8F8F